MERFFDFEGSAFEAAKMLKGQMRLESCGVQKAPLKGPSQTMRLSNPQLVRPECSPNSLENRAQFGLGPGER